MSVHESDNFGLQSLLSQTSTPATSVRSSFEYAAPDSSACCMNILDEPEEPDADALAIPNEQKFNLPLGKSPGLSSDVKRRLHQRNPSQTRWVNFTQSSSNLTSELSDLYLDGHGCLDLHAMGTQMLGGPIKCRDGSYFVWIQTTIPFLGKGQQSWSRLEQCGFKMVVCLPTPERAGTVLTNFTGEAEIVKHISEALTAGLLDEHSMGKEALSCVWVLACSIIRAVSQQMDAAFRIFDPLDRVYDISRTTHLPTMLNQANDLARVDRYIAGLEEILGFFNAVRSFQQSQKPTSPPSQNLKNCYSRISDRSNLESEIAKQKIVHARELCRTHIKQHESHIQLTLSYSTTQIANNLDKGSRIGERITTIGLVLAAISGLTSPLAVVTSYFGMNVVELVEGDRSADSCFIFGHLVHHHRTLYNSFITLVQEVRSAQSV
ncbi:hypothetical protein LTS08_006876 [Lithohypha guttulata]|uniref:uncharacterized protein n=1 Tax=Lithohypha guttulata TaxID=1690604 RepID=UPI002DDE6F57|nr:hypothetical protein LTR51_001930 [Lithohypha guttulata]KAK5097464.1 hypothetical protein LTS08_006876 [Lithohypha guttulata]